MITHLSPVVAMRRKTDGFDARDAILVSGMSNMLGLGLTPTQPDNLLVITRCQVHALLSTMSFPPTSSRPDFDPMEKLNSLMSLMLGGPMDASNEGCMETEWRGLRAAPIFVAANKGNVTELTRLLNDPDMRQCINDLDGDKCGILHTYALNAKVNDIGGIVNAVIDAGGNVNLRNCYQETPLQMALIYSQVEVVKALLERGARIDLVDWKGDGPVPTARKNCKHSGKGSERCCRVLQMLLEAEKLLNEDESLKPQADLLRDRGNMAFQKGEYQKARDLYTQSLEVLDDYRAYSNRALCNPEFGKTIINQEWPNGNYPRQIA